MASFFTELKRRNVYKVAVAYAAIAWLLIQLASILFPTFDAPGWVMKVFVAVVAFGFPLALVFAWAFELTPEGIKRTEEVAPGENARRQSGRKLMAGVAVIAVLAAGLLALQLLRPNTPTAAAGPAPSGSAASPAALDAPSNSIAVLPFVNMSGDPANEYFSDGITEEILNAVAHLPDLRVASRTSAFAFKGKNQDIGEIARTLRVTNVLEGSVQRMGDRVRITAQLIDAKSGFHLWSQRFDREAKDLFAVQDEIAQAIARALKLELTAGGKGRAQRSGTENVASHDAYLKALDAEAAGPERRQQALSFADQAIALDPKFAAAYALKAMILSSLAFGSADESAAAHYIEQGEQAAKRAVELDPNLAEAHAALGEMARRRDDQKAAREYLGRAVSLKPADPGVWQSLGLVLSRSDSEGALRAFVKAKELGNTSVYLPRQISYSLDALGRVNEAYPLIREQQAAHPEFVGTTLDLGRYELWVNGRPDRALKLFVQAYRQAPTFVDGGVPVSFYPALVYAISGHRRLASEWLARQSATAPDSTAVAVTRLLLAAAEMDRETLGSITRRAPENALAATRVVRLAIAADAALLSGDFARAAEFHRELRQMASGDDEGPRTMRRLRHELKLAYALRKLGQDSEAEALLAQSRESFPVAARYSFVSWTIYPQTGIFYTDGELYAQLGEKKKSLDALNATLALPDDGLLSFGSLPIAIEDSPLLEPLRGEPGFADFRKEVARRRALMKQRVEAVRQELGLGDDE